MKKIYSLLLLGGLLFFGVENATAYSVINSAVNVNGTWYWATTSKSWCTGGTIQTDLGTISKLVLGGHTETYDNGSNWNSGTAVFNYRIDGGTEQTIAMPFYKFEDNNNKFQTGGGTFSTKNIDLSGLTDGEHTIEFWFNVGDVYDSNESENYEATFTIATATITLAEACTYDSKYYGTYSNTSNFEVPSDLTVATISISGSTLTVTPYSTGDIVPANTGVMVSSEDYGEHTIYLTGAGGSAHSGNMLKPSGASGISASTMGTGTAEGTKFYRLTMHNGTQIGFFYGAANGAAFALGANKAYLEVPVGYQAPTRLWLEDEESNATDIQNVDANETAVKFIKDGKLFIQKDGVVYDMTGRAVK